jgi:acyl-CoA synthetase (AMP-forming)/AMP-acid ligase II/pimeloyl-ACP methyl ester carboxylesterase
VLDTGPGPAGTVVCVHGNPSWGYIWRDLLTTLAPKWRVVAIDQTGMGWSERGRSRRLADRVTELIAFCRQEVSGPLVLAAHDWGGPVAVGASGSLDVEALVLANTAVAKPDNVAVPPLITAARCLVDLSCRRTPAFVAGTARMTDRGHRDALWAPYRGADRREAVRDFVTDIPVVPGDPSSGALEACASVLDEHPRPTLLLWGGRDPVFHDRFLADLRARVPQADVERFPGAAHLVTLDAPVGPIVARWLDRLRSPSPATDPEPRPERFESVLTSLAGRSGDSSPAYDGPDGTLSWAGLDTRSSVAARALHAGGLRPGDRVSLLVPPSCELLVAAAAVWKVGGVPVVADASAGICRLRGLVRAAAPSWTVGTPATLAAAAVLRFAPGSATASFTAFPGAVDLAPTGASTVPFPPHTPGVDDVAAIVHTSGATGPAKAVRYTHGALAAQRDVVGPLFGMHPGDAFTTSFGPFMLLAPSLQMTCVRPDFDVAEPSALGFDELRAALDRAKVTVTVAWLSPASARTILATARGRTAPIDLVMLAGAPIPAELVDGVRRVTGGDVRAPYGMTECLPVTDGTEPERIGRLGGSSTGRPVPGCSVVVGALDDPTLRLDDGSGWGELLVHAPWMFDGYDAAWSADADTCAVHDHRRFHRTGDVGYLEDGLVMHLGRRCHVIDTASGPLASVAVEGPVAAATGRLIAAVGVGPAGGQVLCVVVGGDGSLRVAGPDLRAEVRASCAHRIAAVLEGTLPVDRRHQSKIDRTALGSDVAAFLAGR